MAAKRVLSRLIRLTTASGTAIVTDELEIRQLLTRASEGHTAVTLKIRDTEIAFRGKLLDVDPKKMGIQLALAPSKGPQAKTGDDILNRENLEKAFLASEKRECMVLIYLQGRSILGINAEPADLQDDRIMFAFPPKIFKIQRRKDVRFVIPQGYEYTIEFESQEQAGVRVKKRIIDISESGLSFFVLSPREAAIFKTGLIIPATIIQMQHQSISVMMRVCSHSPFDRGSQGLGNKIGIEFEQISPDDKEYIAQFVYSHTHHLFY